MLTRVELGGRWIDLRRARPVGQGGEADVYDVGGGVALKVFKPETHPDFAGDAGARDAARLRLDEQQRKLPAFPAGLPARVVAPVELATDGRGRVAGYAMPLVDGAEPLVRFGDRAFRQAGVPGARVLALFRDLHATVGALHGAGVVIGDFNDLNVLVRGAEAHLVDADSFQFGAFPSRAYTERFVDPLLCAPGEARPRLCRPYVPDADWYAFTVLLLRTLLFVDPYGGVHRPADPAARVKPGERPLRRISVFHPEVRYPKPAERPEILPDDLLHHFHRVFGGDDLRGPFPRALLEGLRWTRCTACRAEHLRDRCPHCRPAPAPAPAAVRPAVSVRGGVLATEVFRTTGVILHATAADGRLRWLAYEDGAFRREDGRAVLSGDADPSLVVRIAGERTLLGKGGLLVVLPGGGGAPARVAVDRAGGWPAFDAAGDAFAWVENGRLLRDGEHAPTALGDVLAGATRVWAGADFGFGVWRAGGITRGFVFRVRGRGFTEARIPPLRGQVVAAYAVFASERCWFFATTQEAEALRHRCAVVRSDGVVEAVLEGDAGALAWMEDARGACAAGTSLLVPTDAGVVEFGVEGGQVVRRAEHPETEPFVDGATWLLPARDGLYAVGRREIRLLRLAAPPGG